MSELNVHQRLAAAMSEVSYIQKERKQGMNYNIVSHDAVTAKVRPALLKHGIVYYPVRCDHQHNGNRAECSITVRFVNVDKPEDHFDVPTFGYGIDAQDKGPGKAMSYAVKYALLKALGMETGDDPDTESVDYSPRDPATPPFSPEAAMHRIIDSINRQPTDLALTDLWMAERDTVEQIGGDGKAKIIEAFKARKQEVNQNKEAL